MPIYEYECQKCHHITEALRRMSEADEVQVCESCGHDQTVRLQSVFAAQGGSEQELPVQCGSGQCSMPPGIPGMGCGGGMCGM